MHTDRLLPARSQCVPVVVADYNKEIGGVDKADMHRSIYDLDRKSRK